MIKQLLKRYKWQIALGVFVFVCITTLRIMYACINMIQPGYVGIKINLLGEKKGADPKELGVGMHLIPPWKKIYKFPVFEQNRIWANDWSFTFQTGEGLNVDADIGVSYHLQQDMIYKLFCKYRRGIEEITDIFIRNYARDAINKNASKMKIEELYGSEKESFIEKVQETLKAELAENGIIIGRLYLIGTLHFPHNVVDALNAKIEAIQIAQRRENELKQIEAQARKAVAEARGEADSLVVDAKAKAEAKIARATAEANAILATSKAQAESNLLLSKSITKELIKYELARKWNGQLPKLINDKTLTMLDFKDE